MTDRTTIAFVLYDGGTPLDLIGPLQVLCGLEAVERLLGGESRHEVTVVAERIEQFTTDTPVRLVPAATLAEVPRPDVVIVPGGGVPTLRQLANDTLLDYLRTAAESAQVVGSVCTGALVLAAAGLLDGRRATTHWAYHRLLDRLGATYVPERWVRDGRFLTAAGVSAGIDMGLELVRQLTDEDTARMVQLGIEYDPQPPLGGIDWDRVDRDVLAPVVKQGVVEALGDRPDLLERLAH